MTTREDVVREARALIDIRYRHQGRSKHGLDCIGIVGFIGLALGFPSAIAWANDDSCKGYGREPDAAVLLTACHKYLRLIDSPQPGDIYLMSAEAEGKATGAPRHFGVIVEPGRIVHAYAGARKVCETGIEGEFKHGLKWADLILSAWSFRELG